MVKDMLGTAVRKLVTLPAAALGIVCDLLEKMTDEEWVVATKKFLRKENPWADVQKAVSSLLESIGTVAVPALPAFDVATRFHEMTEKERKTAEVPIGWMNDDAKRLAKGLVEPETPETTLRIHKLVRASVDGPILAELGGEETAETALAQMYELMKAQGQGQKGNLLTNGNANIFYIRDANGTLWAVDCSWHSDNRCWHVHAYSVTNPNTWNEGNQVVSRDSLLFSP